MILGVALATVPLSEIALAQSTPTESLTYNRDIWTTSPQKITQNTPQLKWNGLKTDSDALTLWDQPIHSVHLESDGKATKNLSYTLYDSSILASQDSHKLIKQWKSLLSQKSGKPARSMSAIRLNDGASQSRTVWTADDCVILLSSTKTSSNQTIKISFLRKDYAKTTLSISDPDVVSDRTFYSSDFSKSFVGKLNTFDEEKNSVKIQIGSQVSTLSMDQLSKSDQDYIKKMGPYVAVYRGLAFQFKELKSKPVKKGSLSITDFSYNLTVRNNASTQMNNVKLDYYIYYYIGDVNKAGSVLTRTKGSKTIKIYPKMTDYLSTNKLELVKNVVKGRSGG